MCICNAVDLQYRVTVCGSSSSSSDTVQGSIRSGYSGVSVDCQF